MNDLTCHEVIKHLTAALQDAYDFISNPQSAGPHTFTYNSDGYNKLASKVRAALREGRHHADKE